MMNLTGLKLQGLNAGFGLFLSLLHSSSPLQLNGLKMADEPMEEGEPYSYHVSIFDGCSI